MQLKEVLRVQTNAEVYVKISAITHVVSEIGTYIINNAGRQAAKKVKGLKVCKFGNFFESFFF
jgi:hypothetical protein